MAERVHNERGSAREPRVPANGHGRYGETKSRRRREARLPAGQLRPKAKSERSEEVGRPDRGMRQHTQAGRCRRQLSVQPAQRVAALCEAAPREAQADRWTNAVRKGKWKCADAASSRINTGKSPPGARPKVASMVHVCTRRMQRPSASGADCDSDCSSVWSNSDGQLESATKSNVLAQT